MNTETTTRRPSRQDQLAEAKNQVALCQMQFQSGKNTNGKPLTKSQMSMVIEDLEFWGDKAAMLSATKGWADPTWNE